MAKKSTTEANTSEQKTASTTAKTTTKRSTKKVDATPTPTVEEKKTTTKRSTKKVDANPTPTVEEKKTTTKRSTKKVDATPTPTVEEKKTTTKRSTKKVDANPTPTVEEKKTTTKRSTKKVDAAPTPTVEEKKTTTKRSTKKVDVTPTPTVEEKKTTTKRSTKKVDATPTPTAEEKKTTTKRSTKKVAKATVADANAVTEEPTLTTPVPETVAEPLPTTTAQTEHVNNTSTPPVKKKTSKAKSFKKRFFFAFWGVVLAGLALIVLLFWMVTKGWIGYLPPLDELQNPKSMLASEIFSADSKQMGRYYHSNRVSVHYTDIDPFLIDALIATEDSRYFGHTGIDIKSLMRAIAKMGKAGGGSTITQQLAKQLWSPRASNVFERALQKPIEWVIATELERLYSKEEILTMYLNQFDFLYNAVGIKSAAHVYFCTTPDQLKKEESAMLVGMCKNPSLYNPLRRPARALNRRNTVLDQMCKYNYITQHECDSLKALPVEMKYQPVDHKQGLAPYFREYLRKTLTAKEPKKSNYPEWNKHQYEIDRRQWEENPLYGWCNKNFKHDGTPYNLYQDGLRIYTTIDSHMQRYAEEAVNEHMQYLQRRFFREKRNKKYAPFSRKLRSKDRELILTRSMRQTERYRGLKYDGMTETEIRKVFDTPTKMRIFSYNGPIDTVMTPMDSIIWTKHFLRCGFVSMDPKNGSVKAYVGGPDFEYFQYDMVNTGRRQVGSVIKPFLYTLAMKNGFWPCDSVLCDEITLLDSKGKPWTPRDGHMSTKGQMVTINWGLSHSSNWVTAYIMSLFSPRQMVKMMRAFGITSPIEPVVSLCLGPCEISVQEMANAYTAFANKGVRVEPMYVTRIEDINGNVLETFSPKKHEVMNELTSFKMLHMLRNVMNGGTGSRARTRYGLRAPMGGKTGTSQNHSDGWFIGFTPSLVTSVWVGGEDRSIHFDNMKIGQGASTALPIWAIYMQKVYADEELCYDRRESFNVPRWFSPNQGCRE